MNKTHLSKHLFIVFTCCFFLLSTMQLHAQIESLGLDSATAEDAISVYNTNKEAIEYKIRERECEDEIRAIISQFKLELKTLDSLIIELPLNKIPNRVKGNKHLIVSPWKEGDECIRATYNNIKYNKGCGKPAVLIEVGWSGYENLEKAKAEKKLCVLVFNGNGYTQVDKIPSAAINKKTADMLLKKIERLLNAYGTDLGFTYADYVAYEKKKNYDQLKQIIKMRSLFLQKCAARLNKP